MKILSLDLGTSSIGWAIRDTKYVGIEQIIASGVKIFPKGVAEEKGIEKPLTADRTKARSQRRLCFRRKLRKYRTLRALIKYGFCPLPLEDLEVWGKSQKGHKQIYPNNDVFRKWLMINPYQARVMSANEKTDPCTVGRALYHICQRRGFKSGRKDTIGDKLPKDLEIYDAEKKRMGDFQTFGIYQYDKLKKGERVRNRRVGTDNEVNSSRKLYIEEFEAIAKTQEFSDKIKESLYAEIFYQRPLKSQKNTVGFCPFEAQKRRCQISRPEFELFRAYSVINNIKIRPIDKIQDGDLFTQSNDFSGESGKNFSYTRLTQIQKLKILELFFKKGNVEVKQIVKELEKILKFKIEINYRLDEKFPGSPTIAIFQEFFGKNWQELSLSFTKKSGEKGYITFDDVWNVLHSFEDHDLLQSYAINKLGFNETKAELFSKQHLTEGYASLSLKAIKKTLPFLEDGFSYSHAVFLANVPSLIGEKRFIDNKDEIIDAIGKLINHRKEDNILINMINAKIKEIRDSGITYTKDNDIDNIISELTEIVPEYFGEKTWNSFNNPKQIAILQKLNSTLKKQLTFYKLRGSFLPLEKLEDRIKEYLGSRFSIEQHQLARLYHPSKIDFYTEAQIDHLGNYRLGSPLTKSIRNPMAMRTMHQLRYLINSMIKEDIVDSQTQIVIETTRELNDRNKREAFRIWQKKREQENDTYRKEIIQLYKDGKHTSPDPTADDILKYRLYIEQDKCCLYTGRTIGLHNFLGPNPEYDIEHTIPRSKSRDNSQVNKTLACASYNRLIKKNKFPSEMLNFKEPAAINGEEYQPILAMVKQKFSNKAEEAYQKANQLKFIAKKATSKEQKDKALVNYNVAIMDYRYWSDKVSRFTMEEVTSGFINSQLVDTGIVSRYAVQYLKSYFNQVRTVKGSSTADCRKLWGLQTDFETKQRNDHRHHAIDAMTMCFMEQAVYDQLAKYWHEEERGQKPRMPLPFDDFPIHIKKRAEEILVVHRYKNNLLKYAKRNIKINARRIVQTSDKAGAKLHKDTFYGAIQQPDDQTRTRYVVRKSIQEIDNDDIKNIVDPTIREIIQKKDLDILKSEGVFIPDSTSPTGKRPVFKIRLFTKITQPIQLKKHTFLSEKPHKQWYYTVNESNSLLGIYEATNVKAKTGRFMPIIVSTYEYALSLKENSTYKDALNKVLPQSFQISKNGKTKNLELKQVINNNNLVLFFEKDKDEIDFNDQASLCDRLYKVVGLTVKKINGSEYGYISLKNHKCALRESDLKYLNAPFIFKEKRIAFQVTHNQFSALLEGKDFIIDDLGRIIKV